MGISGGGMVTPFASALEPRIKAALISGYLNTFRDSVLSLSHCIDNYVPGILNWAEMYDVAGLIAPRPLFAESGERDAIFPVAASRESFARVKRVYEVFGAGEMTEQEIFDGPHGFCGKRGLPFLAKHLGDCLNLPPRIAPPAAPRSPDSPCAVLLPHVSHAPRSAMRAKSADR